MKLINTLAITCAFTIAASTAAAAPVKSLEQAQRVAETRQAIFKLLGSNMGPLGAMARGKIPFNAEMAEKNGQRINQLSLMIADYLKADTRGHKLETGALDAVWEKPEDFAKRIEDLTLASANLHRVAAGKDQGAIRKAIGGVGKTCGGCHDDFKVDD